MYRATYATMDVAVKVLREEAAIAPEMFEREVRAAASVVHPNAVRLLGAVTQGTPKALVLELCPGGTLRDVLGSGLPVPDAVEVLLQVAEAMAHIHAREIRHGDLKSANVMVAVDGRAGARWCVKVTDFGLSRVQTMTTTSVYGTAAYMAPEVLNDDDTSNERADVYAFGVLGCEVLTGRAPFAGKSPTQMITAVVVKAQRPDAGFPPQGTPEEMAALLRRCWAQDPAERPTFADVVVELRALRERMPRQGVPIGGVGCQGGDEPPERFLCTISKDVMRRPVLGRDGHMYEETVLRRWVRENRTSPMTRALMVEGDWIVNLPLLQEIEEWRHAHSLRREEAAAQEARVEGDRAAAAEGRTRQEAEERSRRVAEEARREAQGSRVHPSAEVNQAVDGDGNTKLILAARERRVGEVTRLLAASGIDVNKPNEVGETPLHWASSACYTEVVNLLLAAPGIHVQQANKNGATPLYYASFNGHKEVVKLLLAVPGIDVNKENENGYTPLCLASYKGHSEVVKLLLTAPGIDINQSNEHGGTPLSEASQWRRKEVVKLLLAAPGIDVNKATVDERTPLYLASCLGDTEVVKALLAVPGIDVNKADEDIRTPLYWASCHGDTEVVKALLAAPGIDVNKADEEGLTPLLVTEDDEIRALLRAAGARE